MSDPDSDSEMVTRQQKTSVCGLKDGGMSIDRRACARVCKLECHDTCNIFAGPETKSMHSE